jgi:hypothetical protein
MDAKASDNPNDPSQIRAPRERVPGYGPAEDDRSSDAGLRDDVIAAVHTQFGEKDAAQVLGWLRRIDEHDRLVIAVLVSATTALRGVPTVGRVKSSVEMCFQDFRDVLMEEYDDRIDYKAELARLGLERPYPV